MEQEPYWMAKIGLGLCYCCCSSSSSAQAIRWHLQCCSPYFSTKRARIWKIVEHIQGRVEKGWLVGVPFCASSATFPPFSSECSPIHCCFLCLCAHTHTPQFAFCHLPRVVVISSLILPFAATLQEYFPLTSDAAA